MKINYILLLSVIFFVSSSSAMRREERVARQITSPISRAVNQYSEEVEVRLMQTIGDTLTQVSEIRTDGEAPRYRGMTIRGGMRDHIRPIDAKRIFEDFNRLYERQQQ